MTTQTKKLLPSVPFYKSLLKLPKLIKNPKEVMMASVQEYGDTYSVRMSAGERAIITCNADYIQHILQRNNRNYSKSKAQLEGLGKYLGRGLLTSEGQYWLQQRRLIQPGFHRQRLAGLVNIILLEVNEFIANFDKYNSKNEDGSVDIAEGMMKLTFMIVSKSLFSTGVSEQELNRIGYIIKTMQKHIVTRIRQPYLRPIHYILQKEKFYTNLMKEGDEILFRSINERKASQETHNDLLDMLMSVRYEDTGEGMTEQQLRDEVLILFVAGHETTGNALTWLWYLLAQHPEIEEKVIQEVNAVVGDEPLTFEKVMQLTYTKQVIQESMRLYPPAWAVDRVALDDDQLGDYQVAKGTIILSFIYGTHRNPNYWNNPDVFDPERFTKENRKKRPSFAYLPFGGGPRLCIGNNFALMEMQIAVAQLIRHFKFELVEEQTIEAMPLVTLQPKYGIQMKVKRRGA